MDRRRLNNEPCTQSFDEKVKSKVTGKLMLRNPKAASFVYNNFKKSIILFFIFLILVIGFAIYLSYLFIR